MDRLKQSEEMGNNPIKIVSSTYLKNSSKNEFTQTNSCLFQKTIKGSILKSVMDRLKESEEKGKNPIKIVSIQKIALKMNLHKIIPNTFQKTIKDSILKTVMNRLNNTKKSKPKVIPQVRNHSIIDST